MPNKRIISKLIKIESFQEGRVLQVKKGDILNGYFFEDVKDTFSSYMGSWSSWPTVGRSFLFYVCSPENIDNSPAPVEPIVTTMVTELIDDRTFRTKNSIYKIVTLEDERDEKIKIILK